MAEPEIKIKAFINHHFPLSDRLKFDQLYYHIRDGYIMGKEDHEHDQEIEISIKEID